MYYSEKREKHSGKVKLSVAWTTELTILTYDDVSNIKETTLRFIKM